MTDKVKLIIEIPKDYYEIIKHDVEHHLTNFRTFEIIGNGIPLDSNSEQAEVQAYFDGQAYGWEEGRKSLIEDLKAEIADIPIYRLEIYEVRARVLQILDNIGKAESEDEE